jgi:ketosteroid isomerase-like protein
MHVPLSLAALWLVWPLAAQTPGAEKPSSELSRAVADADREFFTAFNTCDLAKLKEMTAEDLEFYHDLNGLMKGREAFLKSVRENVCGKFSRELASETVEVFPLKGYGAFQTGLHRFVQKGQAKPSGDGRFAHFWQKHGDSWRLTRVVSYAHRGLD